MAESEYLRGLTDALEIARDLIGCHLCGQIEAKCECPFELVIEAGPAEASQAQIVDAIASAIEARRAATAQTGAVVVELVAKALYEQWPDGGLVWRPTTSSVSPYEKVFVADPWEEVREARKEELRSTARAAIAAMRELTPEMIEAGAMASNEGLSPREVADTWDAMILTALSEGSE